MSMNLISSTNIVVSRFAGLKRRARPPAHRAYAPVGGLRGTILAEGLSYLWRIGISRFSIRISSLRTLRLERGKRVGGEYLPATSIITAKAFRLKAKASNLANGIMKEVKETNL